MAANLVPRTEDWPSKPKLEHPDFLPVRLRFQFIGEDEIVINDQGEEEIFLIEQDGALVLDDTATTGKRLTRQGETIIAYDG